MYNFVDIFIVKKNHSITYMARYLELFLFLYGFGITRLEVTLKARTLAITQDFYFKDKKSCNNITTILH